AGQTQQIVDVMSLAPSHDCFPTEARITPDNDACLGPVLANLADDAFELVHTAGGPVCVRRPQPRAQQVLATEDVQRQITIAAVITMEKTAFLVAMQRIIRGIEIKPDLAGRALVR